ncbi:MAG: putative sulfate exporter family transporter, partial [Desulfuromonas thiophila]|nr:putative sulfate exporter family transporter [Desulfuromonas thiophila]
IAAASLHALLPQYAVLWQGLAGMARQLLVVTLFLIGAGLNRPLLQRVGAAPLALGISLWLLVGSLSLAAICAGWI